jgi:hypothetical protein
MPNPASPADLQRQLDAERQKRADLEASVRHAQQNLEETKDNMARNSDLPNRRMPANNRAESRLMS